VDEEGCYYEQEDVLLIESMHELIMSKLLLE